MECFPDDRFTLFLVLHLDAGRIAKYSYCVPWEKIVVPFAQPGRIPGRARFTKQPFQQGSQVDENRREHQLYIPKVQVKTTPSSDIHHK
jgi:hypothetical protein